MRYIDKLPKIFERANLSRYGTSHDAEYKKTSASELVHALGQNMSRSQYTIKDDFPVFVVSNQGFIGTPGHVKFEEDFRPHETFYQTLTIRGGHCLLRNRTTERTDSAGWPGSMACTYMGDGTTVDQWPVMSTIDNFTPDQIASTAIAYWHGKAMTDSRGRANTSGLMDHMAFITSSSVSGGMYYRGRFVDALDSGSGLTFGSPRQQGSGYNTSILLQKYGSTTSWFTVIQDSSDFSYNLQVKSGLFDGSAPRPRSSPEIIHYATGLQSGSMYNVETVEPHPNNGGFTPDSPPDGYYYVDDPVDKSSSIVGRYYRTNLKLREKGTDDTVWEKPVVCYDEVGTGRGFYDAGDLWDLTESAGPSNGLVGGLAVGETNFAYAYKTDENGNPEKWVLLYKITPVDEGTTETRGHLTFGSWFLTLEDMMRLRNGRTGEMINLSGVLPQPTETATGYSSGLFGEMAVYTPSSDGDYSYVISQTAVFRCPRIGTTAGTPARHQFVLWPIQRHMLRLYLFFEQVVYVISDGDVEAYDMQTFIDLTDLPGFEPAVEKIWTKPV